MVIEYLKEKSKLSNGRNIAIFIRNNYVSSLYRGFIVLFGVFISSIFSSILFKFILLF